VWWVRSKPNPQAALRLLCFPYAGGTASVFRAWHLALPEVEVYGIQLPGRANRFLEPAFTRAPDLVEVLAPALEGLFDKPFVFFGHSMGAIISFELARWLRCHGKPLPRRLFVSGRRAPQTPDAVPPRYLLNDVDFITSLSELNGIPDEVMNNPELVRLALPALRADVELSETYEYREEPPLECPITAFGGVDDNEVPWTA
jgi:medium-chain acyl-[acyl-carrier-protein] hydrolase